MLAAVVWRKWVQAGGHRPSLQRGERGLQETDWAAGTHDDREGEVNLLNQADAGGGGLAEVGSSWRSSPIASARGAWATRNGLGCWNPRRSRRRGKSSESSRCWRRWSGGSGFKLEVIAHRFSAGSVGYKKRIGLLE